MHASLFLCLISFGLFSSVLMDPTITNKVYFDIEIDGKVVVEEGKRITPNHIRKIKRAGIDRKYLRDLLKKHGLYEPRR